MGTPSNQQNMGMGQPANAFPPGFICQGNIQPNSMRPHPDPSLHQMQAQMQLPLQLQFQLQHQMQMQAHGCNSHGPFAPLGQSPPLHPHKSGGSGGNSQFQPNSGPVPNTYMFHPSNSMSSTSPGPGQNAHMASSVMPMQNESPDQAPMNQVVALGIPVLPNSTQGTGHSSHFPTHLQLNSPQNSTLEPVPNNQIVPSGLPMPNSTLGPGQLPNPHSHLQPDLPQMSNNNNMPGQLLEHHTHFLSNSAQMSNNNDMHVAAQQYFMSQQLVAAVAAAMHNPSFLQAFPFLQGFQNWVSSTSVPPLQTNNHQTMPPGGSSASLPIHTNSLSSPLPPLPPYPRPQNVMMAMKNASVANGFSNTLPSYTQLNNNLGAVEHAQNQGQIPNHLVSSHHPPPPTCFTPTPHPSCQHPLRLSNPTFPSPQGAQTFAPLPFMGQNIAEMSKMAAPHLAGNEAFQVGGSISLHQNYQQLQQPQQIKQFGNLQTSEGNSSEQDSTILNSHTPNDMQQFQNRSHDRGLSSGIVGSRLSSHNGGKPYPKWKIESSGFNSSKQGNGRAKSGFPSAHFPRNRIFNNGPSRFQKDMAGGARSPAARLICKNCDRSFTNRLQIEGHFACHVQCDEENCSFEALGKILKEHKSIHHVKQSVQRAAPQISKESIDEIQQWRDERKRNYPTEATAKRKAQQMQERRARGELIDEDAKKRRERMKEILAKQKELGVEVAEVPRHYINDNNFYRKGYNKRGKWANDGNFVKPHRSGGPAMKMPQVKDLTSPRSVLNHASSFKMEQPGEEGKAAIPASEILCPEGGSLAPTPDKVDENYKTEGIASQVIIRTEDIEFHQNEGEKYKNRHNFCRFFQQGYCRKGGCCTNRHICKSQLPKKKHTLLEKLLSGEIKKEKSHLLQIFRFMVNNSFFNKWPNKPLNFFQWSGEASSTDPEQAETQYLSYLSSVYSVGVEHADLDIHATKEVAIGEIESGRDDDMEEDLNEVNATEKFAINEMNSSRDEDLEEGEIEEGEIVE